MVKLLENRRGGFFRNTLFITIVIFTLMACLNSARGQNGTSMNDAIEVGTYFPCGGNWFSDYRNNYYYDGVYYSNNYSYSFSDGQPSPDIWYVMDVSGSTDVSISLCGSSIDTYLHLINSSGSLIASNDNSPDCGYQSQVDCHLNAGRYYIVMEGKGTATGGISLYVFPLNSGTVEGQDASNAIDAGTYNSSSVFSDTRRNDHPCFEDHFGQLSKEIYYKFTLEKAATVTLSHCGSNIDTYLHLLDGNGTEIASNNDNQGAECPGTRAYLQIQLAAGTYYIASEGNNTSIGNITTNIQVKVDDGCPLLASSPSQNQNYIMTYTPLQPFSATEDLNSKNVCEVSQSVEYYDGLGRLLQTIETKGSGNAAKDIVVPVEYDAFGREAKKYLPYAAELAADGSYKANALTAQPAYYNGIHTGVVQIPSVNGITPSFAETGFESSPLNRVTEQGAPGVAWQLGGHTVRTEYGTNTSGGDRAVRLYNAEAVTTAGHQHERNLTSSGNYQENQLYLTISKDENWVSGKSGTTEEYKDKEDHVVLKRVWKDETTPYSTYYVYDDFGNLSFVLPPGADPDNGGIDGTRLNKFCYQYRYDGRQRLIEKRIPGKDGWENLVYNKNDQVVLSQDPRQGQGGKWTFSKYDGLGRVVMSGIYQNSTATRASLQTTADAQTDTLWERYTGGSSGEGYTNRTFPTSYSQLLTVVNYHQNAPTYSQ